MSKTLIVILGPTAVGKTDLTIAIARKLGCPVINCDSRQIYKGMQIGTAAPTQEEMMGVKHYFVGTLDLNEYYSAAKYEADVMELTQKLFQEYDTLLLSGGSMMYIDAVCKGIDDIPNVDDEIRRALKEKHDREGLEPLLEELRLLDPEHYKVVDRKNHKRIIHALEVCYTTGKPYSSFLTRDRKNRPFRILKIGLERPREELFGRINSRVDRMVNQGLLAETMKLTEYRDTNALNTVGYKEMFRVLDGDWELNMAIERLKKNTRVYAKKQMTWFQHDEEIHWFNPDKKEEIMKFIDDNL